MKEQREGKILLLVFALFLTLCSLCPTSADTEMLGKALDYFQGGKFHESLLLFEKLDKKYKLNPRFRAYMGVCYYYDWDYEKACEYLDSMIPQMAPFAPHERSVYYYSNAESHFNLGQYEEAKAYYEQMLNVCYDNEKSDGLYHHILWPLIEIRCFLPKHSPDRASLLTYGFPLGKNEIDYPFCIGFKFNPKCRSCHLLPVLERQQTQLHLHLQQLC